MEITLDLAQTDTKDASKPKIHDLKMELEQDLKVLQKFLKKIYAYKKYWLLY